jgi:hypothetical protein
LTKRKPRDIHAAGIRRNRPKRPFTADHKTGVTTQRRANRVREQLGS